MNWLSGAWSWMVKGAFALAGVIAGFYGGWSVTLSVLVWAMLIDYLSGIAVGIAGKSKKTAGGHLDSNIGWIGILRKGVMMLIVLVGAQFDRAVGTGHIARDASCWFYIANEGLSLLENAALLGVPFPKVLKNLLEQAKEKEGKPAGTAQDQLPARK